MKILFFLLMTLSFAGKVSAQSDWNIISTVENETSRIYHTKASVSHKDIWKEEPLRTIELGDNWVDGDKEGFTYLSQDERKKYKLTFENGRIFDAIGNEYHTDTSGAMFVMTEDGSIYASKKMVPGSFEHHSLMAGKPVVCAGRLTVHAGKLTRISDFSAQYKAESHYHLTKVVTQLKNDGVSMNNVRVIYNVDNQ